MSAEQQEEHPPACWIEPEELSTLTPEEEVEERRKTAQSIFDEFDVDKSGLIEASEVESVFRKMFGDNITEYQVKDLREQIFSQTDANADGKVTFDEIFKAVLTPRGISFAVAI
jgi:Ca2+-binding EF-hand superfamily protein